MMQKKAVTWLSAVSIEHFPPKTKLTDWVTCNSGFITSGGERIKLKTDCVLHNLLLPILRAESIFLRLARWRGGWKKNLTKKVFGNNSNRELVFLSKPQAFPAAVTHKSYFNRSMQKAASAYEAREKICGKASCIACSQTEIIAQL